MSNKEMTIYGVVALLVIIHGVLLHLDIMSPAQLLAGLVVSGVATLIALIHHCLKVPTENQRRK